VLCLRIMGFDAAEKINAFICQRRLINVLDITTFETTKSQFSGLELATIAI
jgi:hypothetical protein